MDENERIVIEKALEGSFPYFGILKNQIENLKVRRRISKSGLYDVEYIYSGEADQLLKGAQANMSINDISLLINESRESLFAELIILNGHISVLTINGRYDFLNNFSIKDVFWTKDVLRKNQKSGTNCIDYEIITESNKRDFEFAIGYFPNYM
ncbi:hypothetical protein [Undibacterium sp. Tian12W]|uniref:hypothetical protein n=1 Tax=Undibacterium sp. Tian12W TaxID=3413054 RepID=UPI003BEF7061